MEWRECPGFPAYEVSEFGDIRRRGKCLRPFKSDGYWKYSLSVAGVQSNVFAHRMVAMAFIGPPPFDGALACHRDGSRTKNHYSNLRWDTHKGNFADMVIHGRFSPLPHLRAAA
jgi:hypothetical protein